MNIYFCGLEASHIRNIKDLLKNKSKHYKEIVFRILHIDYDIIPANNEHQIYLCVPESSIDDSNGIEFSEKIRQNDENAIIIFLSQNLLSAVDILKKYICPAGYFLFNEIDETVHFIVDILDQQTSIFKSNDYKIEIISNYKKIMVPLNNVIYFVSCNKKIICHLSNGKFIEFYGTLTNIEKIYDNLFIRSHSGYLINKQKITSINYTKNYIEVLHANERIPISRKYRSAIKDFLN